MKSFAVFALLACGCVLSHGAQLVVTRGTPMERVVGLLTDLEAKVELDGKLEQDSYDKYACWCETTLARKANDISTAKELIVELESEMVKLSGEIASHGAEIQQLKKDIAANLDSQREATEVRDGQYGDYKEERTESEQCIGALEAAVKVLTGAGTGAGKKGFLETLQESQLISVAAGVRHAVGKAMATSSKAISDKDLQIVRKFMNRPEDFVGGHSAMLSAAQIANNPFGDYAPQSTQIQGILKGMYDSFTTSLEKANAEEAEEQKSHEELMATKQMELKTLQLTLEKQTLDKAQKTKKLAENKQLRDDTRVQLEADEAFFADTKEACKVKASEWSERTRLRTEELHGIGKAIQIMTSPEAQATFENATTTFLQVASKSVSDVNRGKAFGALKQMAKKYRSVSLSEVASEVQTGGHFDKVIESVDKMIAFLRTEEKADIDHRDRCQGAENKNTNDMDDLNHEIDKSGKTITRLEADSAALQTKIEATEADIKATLKDMETLLQMRNDEHAVFKQALKDDSDAIELLEMAIVALSKFYKKNKIPMSLLGKTSPEYTVDPDKAPETTWDGGDYGGKTSETEGIVAIIGMLKEDMEKEMKVAREEEAADQENYEKDRAAMNAVVEAHKATKVSLERQKADVDAQIFDTKEYKGQKSDDLGSEAELNKALYTDCSWVKTHFDTRRSKRKTEMAGLNEAKDYLAGME